MTTTWENALVGLDTRPAIVTESVVRETRAAFLRLMTDDLSFVSDRPAELAVDLWDEVMRRCHGWPLGLREAAWLVSIEVAYGNPRCWLPRG